VRDARIEWFEKALALSQINTRNGRVNCGHCAVRLDDRIRNGAVEDNARPVPTQSAKLFTHPTFGKNDQENHIIRSFTHDERILDRCLLPKTNNESVFLFDITDDSTNEPLIDLTYEEPGKTKQTIQARLMRVDTKNDNLNQRLTWLRRRVSDNTCFGFIFLAQQRNLKIGHILNFFVDNDNEVYFIDAQSNTITDTLNTQGYLSDVFFIQSAPKEPLKIKQEPSPSNLIKAEPELVNHMANEVDIFINDVIKLAKKNKLVELETLINAGLNLNVLDSQGFNVAIHLGMKGDFDTFTTLQRYGVKDQDFYCGAILSKNREIINSTQQRWSNINFDYLQLACFAARTGDEKLTESLLSKVVGSEQYYNINYNLIAAYVAQGGHEPFLKRAMSKAGPYLDRNLLATFAAEGGHDALIEVGTSYLSQKDRDDYKIAGGSAKGGHQALTEKLLASIPKLKRRHQGRIEVACNAVERGYYTFADTILTNITTERNRKYYLLALRAAKAGYYAATKYFLAKDGPHSSKAAFNIALEGAEGGHPFIVEAFLAETPESERNYHQLADVAERGGCPAALVSKYRTSAQQKNRTSAPQPSNRPATQPSIPPTSVMPIIPPLNPAPLREKSKFDIFVKEVVELTKTSTQAELKGFIDKEGHNVACRNSDSFSAAMYLGIEGNFTAFSTLEKCGATVQDFFCGAVYANNKKAIDAIQFQRSDISFDNMWLANYAARGGNLELTIYFLLKTDENKRLGAYNWAATWAARGGHQTLTEILLANITDRNKRAYNQVVCSAAIGGHRKLVKRFLTEIPENQRDYNKLAISGAQGGYLIFAEAVFAQITDKSKRNYNHAAEGGAWGGYPDIVEAFLAMITDESQRDYCQVADTAEKRGFSILASKYKALALAQKNKLPTPIPPPPINQPITQPPMSRPIPQPITPLFNHPSRPNLPQSSIPPASNVSTNPSVNSTHNLQEENKRLREENKRLQRELEFIKLQLNNSKREAEDLNKFITAELSINEAAENSEPFSKKQKF